MSNVAVTVGQTVRRGQVIGRVSNQFGGTATTVHLHFNIRKTVSGFGSVYAPTYMSLIRAYEALMGGGMMSGPRFGAQFVSQSFPLASTTLNLAATTEQRGYFEFRNTGTDTWRPGEVFMGTTQPRDRVSPAQGSDWVRSSRAATIDRVVAPGATGRFNFSCCARRPPWDKNTASISGSFARASRGSATRAGRSRGQRAASARARDERRSADGRGRSCGQRSSRGQRSARGLGSAGGLGR